VRDIPHRPEFVGPGNDCPDACFGAVFVVADDGHLGENTLDLGGSLGSKASADCQQEQYCRSDFEWIYGWCRHSSVGIWINRMKIIKSLVLDESDFGEGKGGAKELVPFGLLRMSRSCVSLINSFIIRLLILKSLIFGGLLLLVYFYKADVTSVYIYELAAIIG